MGLLGSYERRNIFGHHRIQYFMFDPGYICLSGASTVLSRIIDAAL